MINNQDLLQLLDRIHSGTATDQEIAIYNEWCNSFQKKGLVIPDFKEIQSRMLINIDRQISVKKKPLYIYRIAAAASVVLCLGIAYYFYQHNLNTKETDALIVRNDVAAGGNKATLTLANGKEINLRAIKGEIIINASQITYKDGTSVIDSKDRIASATGTLNKITTPRGGQYHVILPDGTKVWLNAASTLKFPSTFNGVAKRSVELKGEAYFEVAKIMIPSKVGTMISADGTRSSRLISMPFIVKTAAQEVEVLGTHFNINDYSDENATRTTLLEGAVRVVSSSFVDKDGLSAHRDQAVLKPGEQSLLSKNTIKITNVNTDAVIAWKNALFIFDHDDLESIMRKISRWYDVEIVYMDQKVKQELFSGRVSRFENVSEVLRKLSLTGAVKFKIEGRRIWITK